MSASLKFYDGILLISCLLINTVVCLHGNASSESLSRYRARVGRIFIAKIGGHELSKSRDSPLPAWLHRRADANVVEGVPLDSSAGDKVTLPDYGIFVEVLPRAAFGNVSLSAGGGGCSRRPPTVAAVLVDVDPEAAGPERLAALLRNLSAKLQVKISTLEVSPDQHHPQQQQQQHQRQYLLASGPGNANIRRSAQACLVTWQVGCGSIDARHLKALERLERLAMTGELTPEPVLLWYVADLIAFHSAAMEDSSSSASNRLRRSAANSYYARRSQYSASSSMLFLSDSAPPESSSGFASPPQPTRESKLPAPEPAVTRRIELPTYRPPTTSATTTTTTATTTSSKTTTAEPSIRQLFQMSSQPYSFPVGVLTRIVLMPNAKREDLLADLKTGVTGCGHENRLGVFGRYYPDEMVLEGHPTAKDIGSQHKCSLHVTDSRGKQDFFGFTIRVPEPLPPQPLPSSGPDSSRVFSLLLGVPYSRLVNPSAYFAHALAHDIRVCVTPSPTSCVSFPPDSPFQFNRLTNRVYGLAWQRSQVTGLPRPVYLLATSKYNKTTALTAGYRINEPRPEDSVHQNKINHQYKLHVESDLTYLHQLETDTSALYSVAAKLGQFLDVSSAASSTTIATDSSEDRLAASIHLKLVSRTDSRSRSMVLVFGCIINYGLRYCPRMSIIDAAKKMFRYCNADQADGRPWPEFSAALSPQLTPVQLTTTPLGTCTSDSYQFPMRFYMAPAASCPNNNKDSAGSPLATTAEPAVLPPLWMPPTMSPPSSGLRVNYVTSKEHGVYCLLPFSTSVGSGFSRPIKRLGCVNDSRGNNLRVLPLQLCTYANEDGSVCINSNKFIKWNATIRGFEGIPFDADVGSKHFFVLVRNSLASTAPPPVRFNLSVVVEQPQWGPFRFHRVKMRIEVDRYRVRDLTRQYEFFRLLNDLVSATMSGEKVYMRLPPDDLVPQLGQSLSVVNFTVDWSVVNYDSDGAVIEGFGKYRIFCPVDQLVFLRRVATKKLPVMLKSNAIIMHDALFLLEGNCSSYSYGDLIRFHSDYMQRQHPINPVLDYPTRPNEGDSVIGNGGSSDGRGRETAAMDDSNVLLITVAPACGLVLLALFVALLVACCLYRRKPASHHARGGQQQQSRSRHVSYQQQQQQQQPLQQQQLYQNASLSRHAPDYSLTSKHVPIIFAEELEERPSAPSKPLILPNEKPPLPPPDIDGYDQEDLMLMERTPLNPQQQQQQLMLMQQQQQQFATLGRTNNGHSVNNGGGGGNSGGYRTLQHQHQQQQQPHVQYHQSPAYDDRLPYA